MNEGLIFRELTELDDDLVTEASLEAQPRRAAGRTLRLPLVAAAILLLLAATAYAVKLTLSVRYADRVIERAGFTLSQQLGYGPLLEDGYYLAEVDYRLEPVEVKNGEALTEALTAAWENWKYGYEHFTGAYLLDETGARRRFDGLAEAAAAFGLPLTRCEALDRADGPCYLRLLIADPASAALEYRSSGKVSPAALVLEDALRLDGSESGITVFVSLREELPPDFQIRTLEFLHQEGRPAEQTYRTPSGAELILLQTGAAGEEYNSCAVVWCERGIGYLAILRGRWDEGRAQDRLMPLLSELALP